MLYFENMSHDTADAYLADGLTDEIIARLGQIERLAVKSRTAVVRYRATTLDPGQLGRALSVAYLVNGTVRRGAARLRVTVELLRATNGNRVWGQQYDRTNADLLAIEADIGSAVVSAIAGRLAPAERRRLTARRTTSADAYDHYLRGNYAFAQRNPRAEMRAIEEYAAAERLDPAFAQAIAREAIAYGLFVAIGWRHTNLSTDSLVARGLSIADRALQADSMASDAWMARAVLLAVQSGSRPRDVRQAYERAIALDSSNAEVWHQYGMTLLAFGADSAGAAGLERALTLEPDRVVTIVRLAEVFQNRHRFVEAAYWLDSAVTMDPGFHIAYVDRARARLRLGDLSGARSDAELAVRLAAGDSLPGVVAWTMVLACEGDTTAARDRFARAWTSESVQRASEFDLITAATAFVALGERDSALTLLERLPDLQHRTLLTWWSLRVPELDPLRGDPRFQRIETALRPPLDN